jgi:hypothetical protein
VAFPHLPSYFKDTVPRLAQKLVLLLVTQCIRKIPSKLQKTNGIKIDYGYELLIAPSVLGRTPADHILVTSLYLEDGLQPNNKLPVVHGQIILN